MNYLLSAERISVACRHAAGFVKIEVVSQTGSTNADLMARLPQLQGPVLLAAETQSQGRGRAGRSWHSASGAALTFSLAWKFRRPLAGLAGLPLAVGVTLADTLGAFGAAVRLKWPNDLLKDGRKLGGVLIESGQAGAQDATWAVIGIGINMALPPELAAQLGREVADLAELRHDRNLVLAALLDALVEGLMRFERKGFAAFCPRWNQLHAYAGQPVVILDQGRVLHEGGAVGVDEQGQLLLDTAAGRTAVMAGDVSLRTQHNQG